MSQTCCDPKSKSDNPNVAPEITVNGTLIPESIILAEMQYHPASSHREAMVKAAEYLIISELLKQHARELGIKVDEMTLDTVGEYQLIEQMLEMECPLPDATSNECQRYFDNHRDKFQTSPLLEVRHILLAAPADDIHARHEAKELADTLLERIKQDKSSFGELAKAHSACPSKVMEGNLGQISKGQTVAEFERHILSAQPGLVPYPIESRYGFHIALVERRVDGNKLPYEQVKDDIKAYLDEKVKRKTIAQYIQRLIAAADIKGFTFDIDASPLMQ